MCSPSTADLLERAPKYSRKSRNTGVSLSWYLSNIGDTPKLRPISYFQESSFYRTQDKTDAAKQKYWWIDKVDPPRDPSHNITELHKQVSDIIAVLKDSFTESINENVLSTLSALEHFESLLVRYKGRDYQYVVVFELLKYDDNHFNIFTRHCLALERIYRGMGFALDIIYFPKAFGSPYDLVARDLHQVK